MKATGIVTQKILSKEEIIRQLNRWKITGKTIAFTNGCFDILHQGHIYSLSQAAQEADILIVGLNADSSVKILKGNDRPINDEKSRAILLASLIMVDAVVIFEEETPLELIKSILPDVLIKGGDYKPEQIAGAKEVTEAGGKVVINPIIEGFSTTSIIEKAGKK
jgi:D-glycero-beta-D-manno-heptose 1-phosphate adenylyltransferase